jgi:hypothetical protein
MDSTSFQYIVYIAISIIFIIIHFFLPGEILYKPQNGSVNSDQSDGNDNIQNYKGYENIVKENAKYASMIGGVQQIGGNKTIQLTIGNNLIEGLFTVVSALLLSLIIVNDLTQVKNIPLTGNISKYAFSLLPIVLIIPLAGYILNFLPGWKSIFSNTFGYLFNFGASKSLKEFVTLIMDNDTDIKNKQIIEKIYADPSIYYSILTPENFNDHLEHLLTDRKLQDIEKTPNTWTYQTLGKWNELEKTATNLGKFVLRQDYIGKYIWYLFFGIYAISISSNIVSGYISIPTDEDVEKMANDSVKDKKKANEQVTKSATNVGKDLITTIS